MNNFKLLVLSLTIMSSSAFAGAVNGGGGKGVLCGNDLTTLDLYDAKINGIPAMPSTGDLNKELIRFGVAIYRYNMDRNANFEDPQLKTGILDLTQREVVSKFRDIAAGARLPWTEDATVMPLPPQCKAVQIAIYQENGFILRDPQYWNMLNEQNKAALILHELMYHIFHEEGSKSSDETRMLIGRLFNNDKIEPKLFPVWGASKRLSCIGGIQGTSAETFEFYAIENTNSNGTSGVTLYFHAFKSLSTKTRVTSFLQGATLKSLTEGQMVLSDYVKDEFYGKKYIIEAQRDSSNGLQMRVFSTNEPKPLFSNISCQVQ